MTEAGLLIRELFYDRAYAPAVVVTRRAVRASLLNIDARIDVSLWH